MLERPRLPVIYSLDLKNAGYDRCVAVQMHHHRYGVSGIERYDWVMLVATVKRRLWHPTIGQT
jgi:hypothetical protein